MVKQIVIEFEKGGKFVADLLENEAPRTCKAIWDKLPIVSDAQHAQYSGQLIFFFTPTLRLDDLENPKVMGLFPGDISFNTHFLHKLHLTPALNVPQEMFITYGGCIPADWCGPSPVNHFAKITQGSLEELAEIGKRTRREGFEKITMKKKD
jgi:hypothetical protein